LSFVALFIVFFYSYTKRFTIFSHIFIGISLTLAPIGAYLAVIPQFNILPIILSAIVLLWVAGFDIIYALQDEQFDRQNNLFSIPAALGYQKSIIISEILHIISAILIIILGVYATFGALYWIGTILFITLLFYLHYIVRRFGMSKINLAFFTLNGIASIIFGMTTFIDIGFKYCLF